MHLKHPQNKRQAEDSLLIELIRNANRMLLAFREEISKEEKEAFISNQYLPWYTDTTKLLYKLFDENSYLKQYKNGQSKLTDIKSFEKVFEEKISILRLLMSLTPDQRPSAHTGKTLLNHEGIVPAEGFIFRDEHSAREAIYKNQKDNFFRKCTKLQVKKIPWNLYDNAKYEVICASNSFSKTDLYKTSDGVIDNRLGCPRNCHCFTSKTKNLMQFLIKWIINYPKKLPKSVILSIYFACLCIFLTIILNCVTPNFREMFLKLFSIFFTK